MNKNLIKVLVLLALFINAELFATFFIEKHYANGEITEIEKIWIKDSMYKIQRDNYSFIIDTKTGKVIFESHRTRLFWEGNYTEFISGFDKAKEILVAKMFESMPPEQRKAAEDAYKKAMSEDIKYPSITIEKTNKKEKISGYDCEEYIVKVDNQIVESFFHTSALDLYSGLDFATFKKIEQKMEEDPMEFHYSQTEIYQNYMYNGLIMRITDLSQPYLPTITEEVVVVDKSDFDPTLFLSSVGYHIKSLEEIFMAEFMIDQAPEVEESE
jgi:hypothetical protein